MHTCTDGDMDDIVTCTIKSKECLGDMKLMGIKVLEKKSTGLAIIKTFACVVLKCYSIFCITCSLPYILQFTSSSIMLTLHTFKNVMH